MKISIEIVDEDGETVVETVSERDVPGLEEFKGKGFAEAFDMLETAVLEARKEASDAAVGEYISDVSKKKRKK